MPTVTGYIAIVQEARFRLLTDDGRALLLTLSNAAPGGAAELRRLHASNAHVVVKYDGEPNLRSGVARSLAATSDIPPVTGV